jgi:small subunit ribosomal protein S18
MDERQTENEEIDEEIAHEGPAPLPRAGAAPPDGPRAAGADQERPKRRGMGRRRRVCIMCADKIRVVDYKNVSFLRRFVSERGRIDTRRKTSACAKHQRALASAIKRARHLALIPYTAGHVRGMSTGHR